MAKTPLFGDVKSKASEATTETPADTKATTETPADTKVTTKTPADTKVTTEKEKARIARKKKRDAYVLLSEYLLANLDILPVDNDAHKAALKAAAEEIKPGHSRAPINRGIFGRLTDYFADLQPGEVVTEFDVFKAEKAGRYEMRDFMKRSIQEVDPEDRVWVSFDNDKETYTLVAKGPATPDNWTGFLPKTA